MDIGFDTQEKTLEESINFNKDNLFEYIRFIQFHQNANCSGKKADKLLESLNEYMNSMSISCNIKMEINDVIIQALNEVSDYAYEAGFKEACRLIRTINTF